MMKRFLSLFLLFIVLLSACSQQTLPRAVTPSLQYVGANVEKLSWTGPMRLWETFTPGHYQHSKMAGLFMHMLPNFNTVRLVVGSKHIVQVSGYKENLLDTLKLAQQNNVYVVLGIWPAQIATNVSQEQFDPYFDANGFALQKQSMRDLAQLIRDNHLESTILYIDMRNEINGHIGSAYDGEWNAADTNYGYQWGYVPNRAITSWRGWLQNKYNSISSLNSAWGTSYSGFSSVPMVHQYSKISAGNTNAVARDDQAWLIWCLRDWVTQIGGTIKAVDPAIQIGQSTTNNTYYSGSYPNYEVGTRQIFSQLEIGDLVDVLDMHIYNSDYKPMLDQMRRRWPNKLLMTGEFYDNLSDRISYVANLGGQTGMLFWATGCASGDSVTHCIHYWDDFSLTSTGQTVASLFKQNGFNPNQQPPTLTPTKTATSLPPVTITLTTTKMPTNTPTASPTPSPTLAPTPALNCILVSWGKPGVDGLHLREGPTMHNPGHVGFLYSGTVFEPLSTAINFEGTFYEYGIDSWVAGALNSNPNNEYTRRSICND